MIDKPNIRKHLLWDYSIDTMDYDKHAVVVIERVIERGNLSDWKEIVRYYGQEKIKDVAQKSKRLNKKDRYFTPFFLQSGFLNDSQST